MTRPAGRKSLVRDTAGTALTEFAIILPVMLALYLGGFQVADAASCSRRVTITSRSMADLVSQYALLDPATLKAIINSSQQMMAPYRPADTKVRISQVAIDVNGKASVAWSDSSANTTALTVSQDVTASIPVALRIPNSWIILSEVSYPYSVTWAGQGAITLRQQAIMLPRRSSSVTLSNS